jgi:4-aminobutyrate aminotransferase / (S)-3-amino-2-methylpropionate transaminase / 5-aminovalerate transaminase
MNQGISTKQIEREIDQLFSSLLIEQKRFQKVIAPQADKKEESEKLISELAHVRGRALYFPYLSTGRGHGPFTELIDGSVKYDLICSIGVNLFGHSHPLAIRACLEAATFDSTMCGNLQPYPITTEISKSLIKLAQPSRLEHFWFTCSGSFANDNALKLIWQKKHPAKRVMALKKGFTGRTIATQEITDNPAYREGMPSYLEVSHVPNYDPSNESESIATTIAAIRKEIESYPGEFCALTCELVQGEGGLNFGSPRFYKEIFEEAKRHGLYIWVDEVQTFARTYRPFAFQTYGVSELVDVVTVGKVLQACGTLFTSELNPKPGLISGTFNGALSALLTSSKFLNLMDKGNLYGDEGRIKEIEIKFCKKLELLKMRFPNFVKNYSALGTMVALEFFDSSAEFVKKFLLVLFKNGVIAFSAGHHPTKIRFLLPICLNDEHFNEIYDILETTIQEFQS